MKFRVWRAGHSERTLSVEIEARTDAEATELFANSLSDNDKDAAGAGTTWMPVFVREVSKSSRVQHPVRMVMLELIVRRDFHARSSFWIMENTP